MRTFLSLFEREFSLFFLIFPLPSRSSKLTISSTQMNNERKIIFFGLVICDLKLQVTGT